MRRWLKWVVISVGLIVAGLVFFIVRLQDFQLKEIDPENPPRFIEADFIDLSKIYTISKYRSGIGHSTDDSVEKCRSLRHIFGGQDTGEYKNAEEKWEKLHLKPKPEDAIDIYAPVTGLIVNMSAINFEKKTGLGQSVTIKPDNAPGFKVRIDSLFLEPDIKPLGRVKAGQKIGVICRQCPGEIFVSYSYFRGERAVSYINALSDEVFAKYTARGLKAREDAVISRAYRDSHLFTCDDPRDPTSGIVENAEMKDTAMSLVLLSGYNFPDSKETKKQKD